MTSIALHYWFLCRDFRSGDIGGVDPTLEQMAGGPYSETNMAARCLPGPYTIANYRARGCTVATNKAPFGPYRGVGRTGACFAIERTIDEVARAVGRDPLEVSTENIIRPEQMPYASIGRMHYDTGDYAASVRLCAELRQRRRHHPRLRKLHRTHPN